MFAVDHSGIAPDLMCTGKALANGFPISACIGTPEVMQAWPESDGEAIHTSTFLGNPLGCAMAVASLHELTGLRLAARAASLGAWWKEQLQETLGRFPCVGEIRGLGLMIGIELVKDKSAAVPHPRLAAQMVVRSLEKGLIILSGGKARNVLTLTPALTVTKDELTRSSHVLHQVMLGISSKAN
jgi:4-aminobutyrate aminotransferase / (S)-3-amino-2-methylpropionate transaminase / 5-aminovalerate transaminase